MNPDRPIRSTKVLRSAKGQTCTARFPHGICNADPATTVWAHLNGHEFGKGMGIKAHDVLGFHSCDRCHAYYDVGHATNPILTTDELLECLIGAICETYVRLIRMGIVIVPMDAEKTFNDRPTKPRKPPEERAPITGRSEWPKGRTIPSRPMRKAPTS
jgi:hypothetical protein